MSKFLSQNERIRRVDEVIKKNNIEISDEDDMQDIYLKALTVGRTVFDEDDKIIKRIIKPILENSELQVSLQSIDDVYFMIDEHVVNRSALSNALKIVADMSTKDISPGHIHLDHLGYLNIFLSDLLLWVNGMALNELSEIAKVESRFMRSRIKNTGRIIRVCMYLDSGTSILAKRYPYNTVEYDLHNFETNTCYYDSMTHSKRYLDTLLNGADCFYDELDWED